MLKSRNVVMQEHEYTCGAASLATLLKYCFDEHITEAIVLEAALQKLSKKDIEDRQKNGLSMEDLANGASRLHYAAAVLELKYEKLQSLKFPVIVRLQHDDFKHFVIFRGQRGDRVFLADPLRGNIRAPVNRFCTDWDGKILAVVARGRKPSADTALALPPDQLVTPENEAAHQAITGTPLNNNNARRF
jgi:predicted double-glycine peptidase